MTQDSMPAEALPSRAPATSASTTNGVDIAERGVVVRGLRLATAMSDAPRALLSRVPLVVLPAAGHSWEDYRPILERFAAERRVFAFDWPGFGHSAHPAPTDFTYSAASYAELISEWMDALGIARAVVLGNSVGAAAAVRYAVSSPQRVVGLVLVAPSGFTPAGIVRGTASRVLGMPALLRHLEPAFTSFYLGPSTPDVRALVARHRALRQSPDYGAFIQAYAALWRSFDRSEDSLTELAGQVKAPTIVIRGALDPIVTAGDSRRAAEALASGGALEVVLPDAGHLPFLQQPERFMQAVAGLVNTAEVRAIEASRQ